MCSPSIKEVSDPFRLLASMTRAPNRCHFDPSRDIMKFSSYFAVVGLSTQVVLANKFPQDVADQSSYFTTEYQATQVSSWGVPTLVPCPPVEWINTNPTPETQTKVVTQPVPESTTFITKSITTIVPSHTIITDSELSYSWSTVMKYTTYTAWTTQTIFTGKLMARIFPARRVLFVQVLLGMQYMPITYAKPLTISSQHLLHDVHEFES